MKEVREAKLWGCALLPVACWRMASGAGRRRESQKTRGPLELPDSLRKISLGSGTSGQDGGSVACRAVRPVDGTAVSASDLQRGSPKMCVESLERAR